MRRIRNSTTQRARNLRSNMTDAEKKLWKHLRLCQLNDYKFRRQHPIGDYIVDFICLEKNLVVEVDGGQHLNDTEYDKQRTSYLKSLSYTVIRFWNNEVLNDIESVKEAIWKEVQISKQPPS